MSTIVGHDATLDVGQQQSANSCNEMIQLSADVAGNMTVEEGFWSDWVPLGLSPVQFHCRMTLTNGQSFAWSYDDQEQIFIGVIGEIVYRIQQIESSPARFCIAVRPGADSELPVATAKAVLHDYLHASINLELLYTLWKNCDKRFAEIASEFNGVRLLRQDPIECLFSFICSSNNHISRITMMLRRLREMYGNPIVIVDGVTYRAFPTICSLANVKESELRELGFGYRAKFIKQTALTLHKERAVDFLYSLRGKSMEEIRIELCKFVGVGRKVADCVALFSLDQHHVVPVDTHIGQIAMRHYHQHLAGLKLASKSLSDKVYGQISSMFIDVFGERAGWAHSILFTSDLAMFRKTSGVPPKKKRCL